MLENPESTSYSSADPTTLKRRKSALKTTLLASSSPTEIDIRKVNEELLESVRNVTNLPSPVKQYIRRLTLSFETTNTKRTLLRNENTKVRELLRSRKERIKGKRVAIKGKFVFNTREILKVDEKAEVEALTKRSKKRRRTRSPTPIINEEEEEIIESLSEASEGEYIIVASRS